MRPYCKVLPK